VLRWLVVVGIWLASGLAAAQSGPWLATAPRPVLRPDGDAGRFARAASIVGVASAGLLLGGAIAIAVVDDPASERTTRGIQLGYTALAAPVVAFGAYSARRDARGVGLPSGRVRTLGWVAYSGAVATGVAQWYGAFHDLRTTPGLTIAQGVLAAFSVLPHAFDAYRCARFARLRALGIGVSPFGVFGRF
jgi:hypothetical protein